MVGVKHGQTDLGVYQYGSTGSTTPAKLAQISRGAGGNLIYQRAATR